MLFFGENDVFGIHRYSGILEDTGILLLPIRVPPSIPDIIPLVLLKQTPKSIEISNLAFSCPRF
jgi:hypothetical protein